MNELINKDISKEIDGWEAKGTVKQEAEKVFTYDKIINELIPNDYKPLVRERKL